MDLDRETGVRGDVAGVCDLLVHERPARLDEPAGGDLLPAVATKAGEVMNEVRRHALVKPKRCRPVSIFWTFVTAISPWLVKVGMTSSLGRDAAVGEEVGARIDRGGVDSEVLEHRGRGDEELRFGRGILAAGGAVESSREVDRREAPACRRRRMAGAPGWMALRSGITVARSSWCGELSDARGQTSELCGCVDRGELPRTPAGRCRRGSVGRKAFGGSAASFASSAEAVTTTAVAIPSASVTAASAAPERA